MMKKLLAIICSILVVLAVGTTAFAASPIEALNGSDSASVKGVYRAGTSADEVYNIEITWGSLEFTYTGADKGAWDPASHAYSGGNAGGWSCDTNADKITVANHSNAAVNATFQYNGKTGYTGITGTFKETSGTANDGILVLPTAVGTAVNNAPSADVKLVLSGELNKGVTNQAIGTVVITLD